MLYENKKKVRFNSKISVYYVKYWERRGEWEEFARDRFRFKRRIDMLSSILSSMLNNKINMMKYYNEKNIVLMLKYTVFQTKKIRKL